MSVSIAYSFLLVFWHRDLLILEFTVSGLHKFSDGVYNFGEFKILRSSGPLKKHYMEPWPDCHLFSFFKVVLKIIKHCEEEGGGSIAAGELVQGVLLGLVQDDTLEITNCFPFPKHTDEEDFDDGAYDRNYATYTLELYQLLFGPLNTLYCVYFL